MNIPYYPTVPLLGIYPTEMDAYVHLKAYTGTFRAALFIIAKHGKTHKFYLFIYNRIG